MILAVPANEDNENATVCMSYGRTPYYMLYDTETKKTSFLPNQAKDDQGGAGIRASQILLDHKVGAVLTQRCGENAAKVLEGASVKIYKATLPKVKDTITAFEKGELSLLTDIHTGFHGNFGGKRRGPGGGRRS